MCSCYLKATGSIPPITLSIMLNKIVEIQSLVYRLLDSTNNNKNNDDKGTEAYKLFHYTLTNALEQLNDIYYHLILRPKLVKLERRNDMIVVAVACFATLIVFAYRIGPDTSVNAPKLLEYVNTT